MIFKGYIATSNKKAIDKIKGKVSFRSLDEVKNLPEYAGILADDVIMVDIDDYEQSEVLFKIITDLKLNCLVFQTTRGKHFVFRNHTVETNKVHCSTAITIVADIKIGTRNSYEVLKFNGFERTILLDCHEDDLQEVPKWLSPVKTNVDFLNMESGDGRNQSLFNYILTLQSNGFTVEESRECIRIINTYILKNPLNDREIETILRDDAFQKPVFFRGSNFLFDKFATYMKNNNHIIKINNQLHIYQDGIYVDGYSRIEYEMIRHIPNLNRAKRNEVIAYMEIMINQNMKADDANLIAFKNGVYNIADDTFTDFSPNFIITNKIPWNYNPDAYFDTADNTLNRISCGDEEIRMLLEEVIGYTFYRRNELGKSFILIGDRSNGKSTFLDMVTTLIGDHNISALDLKELGDRFKTAELFGKLANIGDDIGDEFIANTAMFKKLVTGDRMNVERKGQNPFDFSNYSKLLFSANNIPRMKDKTGAVLRRLIIIPFNAKFTITDPDFKPYIKYELRSPESMEYIINLGISGLKRVLLNRKFTQSSKVEKEIKEYEESNNPIIGFLNEMEEWEIENEPTKKVYMSYSEYCIVNNIQPLSKIEFSKQVNKRLGFDVIDKKIDGKKYRVFVKKEGELI